MDAESLRIFQAVAHTLSITQAATQLGRAPSNITTRIQQLEADLGVALFVRSGRRLALAEAGTRLLDYAQRLLALEDEARQVVSGTEHDGTLRLGSMESTAASRLPPVLASFHARHPALQLLLRTGPSRQLLEDVRTGRLDAACLALPPDLDALESLGLQGQPLWQEDLRLLLPGHETEAHDAASLRTRSLAAFPVGCTYRALAEQWLGVSGSTQWRVQEMASYHAMIACVAAGACVTVLPVSVLALAPPPAPLRTLPLAKVTTWLVWRSGYDTPGFTAWRAAVSA